MGKLPKQLICDQWNEKLAERGDYYDTIGEGYRCRLGNKNLGNVIVYKEKKRSR